MQDGETAEVYVLHRSEHKKTDIVVFRHLHFQVHCIEKKLQHNLSKITICAFSINCC